MSNINMSAIGMDKMCSKCLVKPRKPKANGRGFFKQCVECNKANAGYQQTHTRKVKAEAIQLASNGRLSGTEPVGFSLWYEDYGSEHDVYKEYTFEPTEEGVQLALSTIHETDIADVCQAMLKALMETREKNEKARMQQLYDLPKRSEEYKRKRHDEKLAYIDKDQRIAQAKWRWFCLSKSSDKEKQEEDQELWESLDPKLQECIKNFAKVVEPQHRVRAVLNMEDGADQEAFETFALSEEEREEYNRLYWTPEERKRRQDMREREEEKAKQAKRKRSGDDQDDQVARAKRQKRFEALLQEQQEQQERAKAEKRERRVKDLSGFNFDPECQVTDFIKATRLADEFVKLEQEMKQYEEEEARNQEETDRIFNAWMDVRYKDPAQFNNYPLKSMIIKETKLRPLHDQLFPHDPDKELEMDKHQDVAISLKKSE